jgi:hypothetical protein
MAAIGELVRLTSGQWMARPPLRCPRGHTLRPGRMLVCFKPVDTPGEAYETEIETLSLEPQPDGTYRGTTTRTIQTNECGTQGNVHVVPFVVWRTGPVPPGVVADPPTMSALPQPTSAQQTPGPTPGR